MINKLKVNMKIKQFRLFFLLSFILFFQACSFNKTTIRSIAQTNSATQIEENKNEILKCLIKYKQKLDLRNPYSYNKKIKNDIVHQIDLNQDYINLIQNEKKLTKYNEYFYYAFLENEVKNRNDFLIIGIYKLIFKAFSLEKEHQFTAIEYNQYDMLKLYEYLQVVRWKIRTAKDKNGNYLFNTWQNNWQLELSKKDDRDLNIIKELEYIKNKKESIYDHSNFSFEVLISQMLINIEHSLRKINIEPYDMSISALKSFVFIL